MYFVPVTVAGLIILLAGYGGVRPRALARQLRLPDRAAPIVEPGGASARALPDDEELLAEQLPRGRRPEVAARQPGARR